MKRKIPCPCDNSFEAEVPQEIDLDAEPSYLDEIQNGTFLTFTCPSCGKKHKPEFPFSILWASKNLRFEVLPELDRGEFYRRKKQPAGISTETRKGIASRMCGSPQEKETYPTETIIGYLEMADRLAVIRDGFEPVSVEAIKYFLHLKAEEQYPDGKLDILYFGTEGSGELEFHIHGIRTNEAAIMKVPFSLYQKALDDYNENPKKEIYRHLRVRGYLSVKNMTLYEGN